jgi:poly(ADP-ribose) glycohydrolase
MSKNKLYTLPSCPSLRCLDRFSVLPDSEEDENGEVPLWNLLRELIGQPVGSVNDAIETLETISVTVHGSSQAAGDFGKLHKFLSGFSLESFQHHWRIITQLALSMEHIFPETYIPVLQPGLELQFSQKQVACLVAHQVLCTLTCPLWRDGYHDFSIWYHSEQRHPKAVDMYLTAIFAYFDHLPSSILSDSEYLTSKIHDNDGNLSFSYHEYNAAISGTDLPDCVLAPIEVIQVENFDTDIQKQDAQGSSGAVIVSANKTIGFGQSATQEELFVGNSPGACPAVLFTPLLGAHEVMVVTGARPMLKITGQRRNIKWETMEMQIQDKRMGVKNKYPKGGRMLFMDALEIDMIENGQGLPDLDPENLLRELKKAICAFSSSPLTEVWTGLWGCGAFGGDPGIKMTILWVAASVTGGLRLKVMCDSADHVFARAFDAYVRRVSGIFTSTSELWALLERAPRTLQRMEYLEWAKINLL